jgi:uncharacterized protein (TIGR03067 family)
MRHLLFPFALLCVLPLLGSDSPKEYDDRTKLVELEGMWRIVSVENTGGYYPTSGYMVFREGKFEGTGRGVAPKGNYKVDNTKKPAWLDLTNPPDNGPAEMCIYRIDGDVLKIAWPLGSDERSERLDIAGDRRQSVSTFKRVRK